MDDFRNSRRDGSGEPGQLLHFPQAVSQRAPADAGDAHADLEGASGWLSDGELSTAALFGILWHGLADVVGTAATATLLRRAAQRAVLRWPELAALSITRERLEYTYTSPPHWTGSTSGPSGALSALVRELWLLLVDLTGSVVVRRLSQISELRDPGILPEEDLL